MIFTNSCPADLNRIFELFDQAILYQKTKFEKYWQGFDRQMIAQEMAERRHWKILVDGEMAAFFSVTYQDPIIWGKRSEEPALYLHRIVTNPDFRGRGFMQHIIQWARQHGQDLGKQYIRMDTWGDNRELINYYLACGFKSLGLMELQETAGLPKHYAGIYLHLFQMPVTGMG
jgi:GNAT superfamily N-acetyltransferase